MVHHAASTHGDVVIEHVSFHISVGVRLRYISDVIIIIKSCLQFLARMLRRQHRLVKVDAIHVREIDGLI